MFAYSSAKPYANASRYVSETSTSDYRDALILDHLPKVKYIADRMAAKLPQDVDRDDLYSAGVVGLIDAVQRFDPGRGIAFTTFAEMRVRGAILDNLRTADWASRSVRRRAREIQDTSARLEQQLGRPATHVEIAGSMNIPAAEVRDTLSDIRSARLTHLEDKFDESGSTIAEAVLDPSLSPFDQLGIRENRNLLAAAIERLPERERTVIALYYVEELTMKEIGEVLGVSESRVSQMRTQSIARLRAAMPK